MLNGYLSPPLGDKWPPVQGSHRLSLKGGSAIIQGIHTHAHVCTITFVFTLRCSRDLNPPPPHVDLKVDVLHLVFPTSKKAAAARKRPWVTCNSISLNSLSERIVWGSFRRCQISTLLMFGILSFFFFFVWMICWAISSDYGTRRKMMLKTCAGKSSICLPCVVSHVLEQRMHLSVVTKNKKITPNLTRVSRPRPRRLRQLLASTF